MTNFASFGKKLKQFATYSYLKLPCWSSGFCFLIQCLYRFVLVRAKPLWFHLLYFLSVASMGLLCLKCFHPRTDSIKPRSLDLFFTSVSATTLSGLAVIEMEILSNSQLVVLIIVMFISGEVFVSMVGLQFVKSKLKKLAKTDCMVDSVISYPSSPSPTNLVEQIELGLVGKRDGKDVKPDTVIHSHIQSSANEADLKYNSTKFLVYVVLGYHLVIHVIGVILVSIYLTVVSSAKNLLKSKHLRLSTFSIFTIVSTFANCGFLPTNESMMVFNKNSILLLILIPQALMGNTLFPSCLRLLLWILGKFVKRVESGYLLKNAREIGYHHLLPSLHSSLLVVTVIVFLVAQVVLFCSLEWNSAVLDGLTSYQKIVGVLFQSVNSRHTGENSLDTTIISPAIWVLFTLMMYLPPYTAFVPIKYEKAPPQICEKQKKRRGKIVKNLILSDLSYLAIFTIMICIIERDKMKEDPLNFSVINIIVEVTSAYGNVGLSAGYVCKRQLQPNSNCVDKWYSFSGKWSDEGKLILMIIMIFGRLKKFNRKGGRAWKLL